MAPRPPSDMLFIWVPKNAGSSIHSYLKSNKLPTAVEFHRHKTPDVLVKEGTYTRAQIQERAFAVIRNPYDRALSLWMSKFEVSAGYRFVAVPSSPAGRHPLSADTV